MSDLKRAISRLSGLLTPPTSYTNETKIFGPEPDDVHAAFKQSVIGMAYTALNVGETALAGHPVNMPVFSESEISDIETFLLDDPEQRDFLELVEAIQAVAAAVNRAAT